MEAPSPRYIITRALLLILVLIAGLYGMRFVKKWQRQDAIVAELKSITSDSSFFQQFYAADAQKSLVRAIGLIAEANELGMLPETTIARSQGLEKKYFASDSDADEPPVKVQIITHSLRSNYQNFLKFGYTANFQTLGEMRDGKLPPIPGGPGAGKTPAVITLIDPAVSPGIDKVIANLEIRPPGSGDQPKSDIEIAAAKRLANDLEEAGIIEDTVKRRIVESLTPAPEPSPDSGR